MKRIITNLTKAIAFALMLTTVLSMVSCFLLEDNKSFPEYEDDREMMIGAWDAPLPTLEDIQIAKDMGITHMFLDQYHVKRGTKEYEDALRLYEQVGLKVIVSTNNAFNQEAALNDNTDYTQFPAVDFINYWDEPHYSTIDRIAELAAEHVEKYGEDIKFYGNLLPNTSTKRFDGHTFKEYVQKWAEMVIEQLPEEQRYLSCDVYPLQEFNGQPAMRTTWLDAVETVALQAKKSNAKAHFFLLSTEHYDYRAINEEDIRFQFYVYMAYGAQAFSYFTYADSVLSDFEHAFVSRTETGKIHDTYYMAQTVNNEIKKFDHVYLNYEWQGTLPIIGTNNEAGKNANFDGLDAPLETLEVCNRWDATEDALVGVFKDKDGNDGLIVTNFTDPALGLSNLVRFEFKDVSKVRLYRGGVAYDYEVVNNRLDIELEPGEGVFIILGK